jgi:pSer/pThr/pTyr-binding forkhead associated (FHA) protein
MQAKLVVVSGKASKRTVALKLPTVIGRSKQVGLTVAHPLVSRRHCELFESDGLLMLRDLGSLNGTTIGGRRIEEAAILPDTEFTVGPLTFCAKYQFDGDLDAVPPTRYAAVDEDSSGDQEAEPADEALAAEDFEYALDDESPQAEPAVEVPQAAGPTPPPQPVAESAPAAVPQPVPTEDSSEFNAAGVADFVAWAEAPAPSQPSDAPVMPSPNQPPTPGPYPPASTPSAPMPTPFPSAPGAHPPPPAPYPSPMAAAGNAGGGAGGPWSGLPNENDQNWASFQRKYQELMAISQGQPPGGEPPPVAPAAPPGVQPTATFAPATPTASPPVVEPHAPAAAEPSASEPPPEPADDGDFDDFLGNLH